MNKKLLVLATSLAIAMVVAGAFIYYRNFGKTQPERQADVGMQTDSENELKPTLPPRPIAATFEIYTNGTKRIFTDSKYHDLSEAVYISGDNPSMVIVNGSGITWSDFFETLPLSLSHDCLVTGTNQTFCSSDTGQLKFYINDSENLNALMQEIASGDHLRVVYE